MRILWTALALTVLAAIATEAFACTSDFECGSGGQCQDSSGFGQGICVVPVSQFGQADYTRPAKIGPTRVNGCSGPLDCSLGQTCVIPTGQFKGICIN